MRECIAGCLKDGEMLGKQEIFRQAETHFGTDRTTSRDDDNALRSTVGRELLALEQEGNIHKYARGYRLAGDDKYPATELVWGFTSALAKRLEADGSAGWRYWRHVLGRVALLWVLGMVAQGELLSFDLHRISFFNNTLQTIACGYLIAAAVALIESLMAKIDLSSKEDGLDANERDRVDAERADEMNARFEDVVLNERAEGKFL